jgi:5-formyltetrahydrofolate cyclo-ligase
MTGDRRSLDDLKREMRTRYAALRRTAATALGDSVGERFADAFLAAITPDPGTVVAGYWPINGEADIRPLLSHLDARGCVTALPEVVGRGTSLCFRRWRPGDPLEPGLFGTRQPPVTAPIVSPTVVLVPLLAFDAGGGRLGYGGGFYDRTLPVLRAAGPLLAVGVAYAAQRAEAIPTDDHDQRLDWILTEESAREALG